MKERSKKELAQEVMRLQKALNELEASESDFVQREASSRKAAERHHIVADNASDWEFWLGPDAHFVYSSPSCERITGYSAAEFEVDAILFYRIIHPEDLSHVAGHMNRRKNMNWDRLR